SCLRHIRLKYSCADARAGGVRMVRHSSMDRRAGTPCLLSITLGGLADGYSGRLRRPYSDGVDIVPAVLGPVHRRVLSRDGAAAQSGELGGALRPWHDRAPGLVV